MGPSGFLCNCRMAEGQQTGQSWRDATAVGKSSAAYCSYSGKATVTEQCSIQQLNSATVVKHSG